MDGEAASDGGRGGARGSVFAHAPSAVELLHLALGLLLVWRYRWLFDDSFVYFRYADNALFLGAGLDYNAGEHVEGYSSPLHMIALLALRWLEIPWAALVPALGLAVFAAFWWTAIAVHRALTSDADDAPRLNLPLGVVAASYSATSFFTAGNEGPWLHLFAALTALALLRPESRAGTLAVAALPLVRIELAVALFGVVCVRRFVQARPVLPLIAAAVALNGAWLCYRVAAYADVVPNTLHLKVGAELEGRSPLTAGLGYLVDATAPYLTLPLIAVGVTVAALRRSRIDERAALLAVALATAEPVVVTGGSSMHYYYLAFPLTLALLALGGLVDLAPTRGLRATIALGVVGWTLGAYPGTLDRHPITRAEAQVDLPSEVVLTDPSFFRQRPALEDPWPTPEEMRGFREELRRTGYRGWTDSPWCNAIYANFRVRSVHPYGLTDPVLSRVVTPEVKRGHKPALAALALDLIEVQRARVAAGGAVGGRVYTDAIVAGTAPGWMRENRDAIARIERRAFHDGGFLRNFGLALQWPERIRLDGPEPAR